MIKSKKEIFEAEKEANQTRNARETGIFELSKRKLELDIEFLNEKLGVQNTFGQFLSHFFS